MIFKTNRDILLFLTELGNCIISGYELSDYSDPQVRVVNKVFISDFTPALKISMAKPFKSGEFLPRFSQVVEITPARSGLVVYSYKDEKEYLIAYEGGNIEDKVLQLVDDQISTILVSEGYSRNLSVFDYTSNTSIFVEALLMALPEVFNEDYINIVSDINVHNKDNLQTLSLRAKFDYFEDKFLLIVDVDSYNEEGVYVYRMNISDLTTKKELYNFSSEISTSDKSLFIDVDLPYIKDKLSKEIINLLHWSAPVESEAFDSGEATRIVPSAKTKGAFNKKVLLSLLSLFIILGSVAFIYTRFINKEDKDINLPDKNVPGEVVDKDVPKDEGDGVVDLPSDNKEDDKVNEEDRDDVVDLPQGNLKNHKKYSSDEHFIKSSKGSYIYEESELVAIYYIKDVGYAPIFNTEKGYAILYVSNEEGSLLSAESKDINTAISLSGLEGELIMLEGN